MCVKCVYVWRSGMRSRLIRHKFYVFSTVIISFIRRFRCGENFARVRA